MTSSFATVVLALFVPLSIGTFFVMRPLTATMVVALGAEMFLPQGAFFKLPLMPELSKYNLPYLCILAGCLLVCPRRLTRTPRRWRVLIIAFVTLAGGLCTALTNTDSIARGQLVWPAMTLKDGAFVGVNGILPSWVAFLSGYALVRQKDDLDRVLMALGVAGLVYCPLAIVEMRMSPQVHQWIYGYSTGAFNETVRFGGYRPKVLMEHGLTLARFFMVTTLALFVLAKRRRTLWGFPVRFLAWFHLVVLVLCRSTGAIILTAVGVFFISASKPKRQVLLATVVALVALLYPLLRASDLFPVANFLDAASVISTDREGSLAFRFLNEDVLLSHARERLLFGWGYGRNNLLGESSGRLAVMDGHWIIVLGISGLVGYVVSFGMLVWPVIWARPRLREKDPLGERTQLAGIAVMVSLWTVDLLPNGLWAVYGYILAGALMRRLIELRATPMATSADGHPLDQEDSQSRLVLIPPPNSKDL